ncbi:BrnT family toxin [Cupriavidus alkaliphilus]|uniref:BrnT family toxin n=1 Tax=Cupriavidus alkaliphilus TaxID=942866 RepID=UPI000DC5ADC9|nr:BrnT family toxin [Cupriavidus alkaliphilus]MBB3016541.1 hypothetical protein [Cupriavidus alkaliphilus]RAS00755.1 hypothetical protein C7415_11648 [Cupriavidus alkaliphilus]
MLIEFDPAKDRANQAKHGISLAAAESFEWDCAVIDPDTRFEYAEERFQGLGLIGNRVHMVVFTVRGDSIRIISLRRANKREEKRYADQT